MREVKKTTDQEQRRKSGNITLQQAAVLLNCSQRTVQRQVEKGRLHPVKIGKCIYFEAEELEKFKRSEERMAVIMTLINETSADCTLLNDLLDKLENLVERRQAMGGGV
jgi:excisionase family DNA binding protein